jgi:hypothetical protein
MVLIISDVETDELVALSVFTLVERHNQAAELFLRSVHLKVFLATILKPRIGKAACIADRHRDCLSLLEFRSIKIACSQEYRHHIVDATAISTCLPVLFAVGIYTVLLKLTVSTRIAVPYLVYIISTALFGSLAEV